MKPNGNLTKTRTHRLTYAVVKTKAGWIGVLASAVGLRRVTLPQRSPQEALRWLGDTLDAACSSRPFLEVIRRLSLYFEGREVTFPDELDMSAGTAFQRQVWEAVRLIAYGETRSYGWVAGQIKRPGAARAVGQALARNPFPVIVPCHRVLASNGALCGFGGGLDMKRRLLSLENSVSAQ